MTSVQHIDTVVIGAGQAGLSAAYHLQRARRPFIVLESDTAVGGSWQYRWDSMRLFTPSTHDGLPGMPFPGRFAMPTAKEMTAYLQEYASRFDLPVRTGVHVDGLFREGDGYRVTAADQAWLADNVILANGCQRRPRVPSFARDLDPGIVALHAADYRSPEQVQDGDVLVVGAGNSGADIALELSATHRTLLSGRHPGHLPLQIESRQARIMFPVIWWTWTHVLTVRTPMGRKVQAERLQGHGDTLIRVKPDDLEQAGVERLPRISGVEGGCPVTEDGAVLDVANVVWCTGFDPDYAWISVDGLDTSGRLPCRRGVIDGQPGLYVLGQEFQYMFNSHTVGGVGREAGHVVRHLARRPVRQSTAA